MANEKMTALFDKARRAGVPILLVRTADQAATIDAIARTTGNSPLMQWDCATGLRGIQFNRKDDVVEQGVPCPGQDFLKKNGMLGGSTPAFVEAMLQAAKFPQSSVLFALNAHRQLQSSEPMGIAAAVQSVANLRDVFKTNYRMLVLLGPGFTVPPELDQDVIAITHELPGAEELRKVISDLNDVAAKSLPSFPKADAAAIDKGVDAVRGLSLFSAEQVTSMSLDAERGLDVHAMWDRKRESIERVDGLSVYRGGDRFDDLRGLDHVKARLRARIGARTPVGVVAWIDEGADVFANVESGNDSAKTDQQRALLVEMENNGWMGMIGVGVPGSGKSAIARAFGNEAGVPTIAIDFGAMENKYVGESEARLRQAMNTIKAVGSGNAFFVLTCNSLKGIRPQFMRRFKKGVFFFDLPTAEEREAIWQLHLKKYQLDPKQPRPDDQGWTGAEIRECCEEAWDVKTTLVKASAHIIPVARSRHAEIDQMRQDANGRFLDASKFGSYKYDPEPMKKQHRAVMLDPGQLPELVLGALTTRKES